MAKFKVGDKVLIDVWPDKDLVGTVKEIDYGGHPGNVYVDYGTGAGSVPESKLRPANSRACNSTNPVVANAMRALNATYQYHDYDVPVIQLGQRKYITIMGVADEETAKAIVRSKPGITIDESRKVKVKNARA